MCSLASFFVAMDTDEPTIISFKELRKKSKKKLVLSHTLQETYNEGLKQLRTQKRRRNDPRFDPRVTGVCELKDWDFLDEEHKNTIQVGMWLRV